jgi:hypothetical protein
VDKGEGFDEGASIRRVLLASRSGGELGGRDGEMEDCLQLLLREGTRHGEVMLTRAEGREMRRRGEGEKGWRVWEKAEGVE